MNEYEQLIGIALGAIFIAVFILLFVNFDKLTCKHDWKEHSTTRYRDPDTDETWDKQTLICRKCGKIKQIKL